MSRPIEPRRKGNNIKIMYLCLICRETSGVSSTAKSKFRERHKKCGRL